MIELKNVSKKIGGNQVLNEVTYTFQEGKAYLVKGHNGSGKTMLLRIICSLITKDSGELNTSKDYTYGILIENPSFFDRETAYLNLKYLANIRKVATDADLDSALQKVGLLDKKKTLVKNFSLGMKQKLGIAQAIMENQNVLLLDEPFNALDRESLLSVSNTLKEEKEKGKIIIVVAHNYLDELEIFDEVLEMADGRIV